MPDAPGLDLGAIRASEGFFLSRASVQEPFPESPQADAATWRFCSTFRNGSTQTLRNAVLDLIANARQKVFVTSFILGDDELIKTLADTADRLTGGVYVIVELSEGSLRKGLAALADKEEKGQINRKVEAEKKRFISLTSQGIAVRGHENCHAKFVVVDDQVAWMGSANLETGAFTKVGEVGVVTDDPAEVGRLARLFARMWLQGSRYELPSTARGYNVEDRRDPVPARFAVPHPPLTQRPSVLWTSDTGQGLLESIHDIIGQARRRLVLASWSLNGMADRPDLLINPVAKAIARGVQVDMFVRAKNERERHRRDAGLLHQLGVRIVADDLNHAKAVIADDQQGALFSANFDAEHGLDAGSGIEVGARLDGTPALDELARYLQHAMNNATRLYVQAPTSRQLHDTLAEDWQQSWPLPAEVTVHASPGTWKQLATQNHTEPVLWAQQRDGAIELLSDTSRLLLEARADREYQLTALPPAGKPAHEELAQWWRQRSTTTPHGYCPAVFNRAAVD
jgi:phosphatidylserine/phosphatidylglycerophosphate/cardiolipin synthase-like enzyme